VIDGSERRGSRCFLCMAKTLDTNRQIDLFGKYKFTKCAPISGLPEIGFLMS